MNSYRIGNRLRRLERNRAAELLRHADLDAALLSEAKRLRSTEADLVDLAAQVMAMSDAELIARVHEAAARNAASSLPEPSPT